MKAVPEVSSERDERINTLVDFYIRGLDKVGKTKRGKMSVVWLQEERKHAVSKFGRAVSMKTVIENRQRQSSF